MAGVKPAMGDGEMSKKAKSGGKKNGNGNKNGNTKPVVTNPPETASRPQAKPATAAKSAAAFIEAAKEAAQKERFAVEFSQVVAVLMRAPKYKALRLSDLEWLVIPPLLAGQCRVALSRFAKDGPIVPVAAATWARVSTSIDKRLSEQLDKPPLLRATEWTSGDIFWLITLAGETQALSEFLPQLLETDFKGRSLKMRVQQPDGKTVVQTLTGKAAPKV